jgi:predicted DCC family thiol-disulfide oxidoreductase YuxK
MNTAKKPKVSIYYDGDCYFCRRSVELIVKYFVVRTREVETAQSKPEIYKIMQEKDSWVVVNELGQTSTTFMAGIEIAKCSPVLRWLVPLSKSKFMKRIGEWTYRKIARNRSRVKFE